MTSIFPVKERLLDYKRAFSILLFFGILFITAIPSYASHFRYGHLTWEPKTATTATFTLINAFTRNGYDGTAQDGFPAVGDIISEDIGGTSLQFGDGDETGQLDYVVIAIDPNTNTMVCRALSPGSTTSTQISHTYKTPNNNGEPWMAQIDSCCRASEEQNNPDATYTVSTMVDLGNRNRSPVSSLPTIVNVLKDSVATFKVLAADPDPNTVLTYRLATMDEAGEDFVQPGPPVFDNALSIDRQTGVVTWDVTGLPEDARFSCQVIVEDRDGVTNNIRTQVAVDFIIRIVNCSASSLTLPIFDQPTPDPSQIILAAVGEPITFTVNSLDPTPNTNAKITLNTGGLPPGATMSPELPFTGTPGVTSVFSWIPQLTDVGSQVVTYTATNECGAQVLTSFVIRVRSDIVPPTTQLTTPRGGESFMAGTPTMIQFAGQDNIAVNDFTLSYSTDNGQTFKADIARVLASQNAVIWNIPDNLASTSVRVQVTARDRDGNTATALSNSFTVVRRNSNAPMLTVNLTFDPPIFGQFTPPFSPKVASTSEIRSTTAQEALVSQPNTGGNSNLIVPFPDLLGYNVYRVPQPAEGEFAPTPDLIARPENLVGSLPFNQNTFTDVVSTSKGDNFAYSITGFYSFGEVISGFDPATTSLPVIKNAQFKGGRFSFTASGSFVRSGAMLFVNDSQSFLLENNNDTFFVRASATSTTGATLGSLIKKGKAVPIVVRNPDGKTSVTLSFTR